jgi:DNA-binding transcriptional LysR family regulator
MELRQLAHFLAVAEHAHFTRAAAHVHVTQSSLSSSIRALERELGSDLFARSTRRVELTEAGRALLPAARRALEAAEEARDTVADVRGVVRGHLAIGAIQTFGPVDIPALLARFHRRHPAVTLRVHHAGVASLVRRTADGELELAFVDRPLGPQAGRIHERPLGSEALVLAVAAPDPLARRRRVRLADLAGSDFVEYRPDSSLRASIDQACHAAGLERTIVCELDALNDLVAAIAHGLGVSLLPPAAITLAAGRLIGITTEPPIQRELVLATPADRAPTPAAAALLALLDDGTTRPAQADRRTSGATARATSSRLRQSYGA